MRLPYPFHTKSRILPSKELSLLPLPYHLLLYLRTNSIADGTSRNAGLQDAFMLLISNVRETQMEVEASDT